MIGLSDVRQRFGLSRAAGGVAILGGVVGLFGAYWDDAWHTDIGRDSAWIAPHLVLYGGVALTALVVAGWGLRVLIRTRSLVATLRYRPLLFAGIGAVSIFASAPLDAWWHTTFGRDAVLWSPPHIIVVFASTTMVTALLAGLRIPQPAPLVAGFAALLLGDLAVAVMEYETDVPQFGEIYYLPVAVAGASLAAWYLRQLTTLRYAVTAMVLTYLAIRLAITGGLTLLGRTAPDLPLAYLGLLAIDLPWRNGFTRYAAGAAGMAGMAWAAAALDLAGQQPGALAIPTIVAALVLAVAVGADRWRTTGPTSAAVAALAIGVIAGFVWPAPPASAHDPGQGEDITTVTDTVTSDGTGGITFTVRVPGDCTRLDPVRLVARRAGVTRTAPLRRTDPCVFQSAIQLPATGHWFIYAELRVSGQPAETWLPALTDRADTHTEQRSLYRPAGFSTTTTAEAVTGVAVYAFGLALLVLSMWQSRRRYGTATHSVRSARSAPQSPPIPSSRSADAEDTTRSEPAV